MSAFDTALLNVDGAKAALPAPSPVRGALRQMPFRVAVSLPLHGMRLRDLRSLAVDQVLLTDTSSADDVPVLVGGAAFGNAELDNVDGQMAVRLTRLS